MPLPQRLARFNRHVTNPIARTVAGRIPPFAIVRHQGRRSGTVYRTPIMAFPNRATGGYVVALTYGPDAQWVKNVLAAGGCEIERRGRTVSLTAPRLIGPAEAAPTLPAPVRWVLSRTRVMAFLNLVEKGDVVSASPGAHGPG
jgi:deazaflavin-dependent oxidoreductase (nitroreductase family)